MLDTHVAFGGTLKSKVFGETPKVKFYLVKRQL